MGEESAVGAPIVVQEFPPELKQMWRSGDWCARGHLGGKGEGCLSELRLQVGTGLKQVRPLYQGESGGGKPMLFTCAGLFSRCSGDVCPVGAAIHLFIHSIKAL